MLPDALSPLSRLLLCVATALISSGALYAQSSPSPGPDGRYMIEFRQLGPNAAATVRAAGGAPIHQFPDLNVVAAWLPPGAVQALRANPAVLAVEEDPRRYPLAQTVPYGITMVEADQVNEGSGPSAAKVCVIDSGYYSNHEDASQNVSGDNDSGTGSWFEDGCGHGTHVAGTIAALDNELGVLGVAPEGLIPLHIVKVFGDNCSWSYSSDLIAAADACQAAGARLINMSLGGTFKNRFEQAKFDQLYNDGLLPVAAAGNDGNTRHSYPASYSSVVSVAAIDSTRTVAEFSQKNNQVELAAPGVGVLSTVPYKETNTLTVDNVTYVGNWIENAARTNGMTGGLVDGGLCTSSGSWSGKVVLCERGEITFFDKVSNVQAGSGIAAVIYNNEPGGFFGTLGDGNTSEIPAISLSQEDGQFLVANKLDLSGTVVSTREEPASGYEAFDGTSMATPHVTGTAALVWSHNPAWTNVQIRDTLRTTAEDLGPAGRDDAYGYGLVQAKAALCDLDPANTACGGGTDNSPPSASFTYECTDLTCSFTDTSTDSDGTIIAWSWDFGDGTSSTEQHPSHTYDGDGTYLVSLTVSDDDDEIDGTSQSITVGGGDTSGITLSATGYKVRGVQHADLSWSGATSTQVDIYRNDSSIATVDNTGTYTDNIGARGSGTYKYQVCEAGTRTCSDEAIVTF